MKIWVVLCLSCSDCNKKAITVFDHKPTNEEKFYVIKECGEMFCISTKTIETEINDSPILFGE